MRLSRHFDRIAIVLSTICILHCLAVPVIVVVLPLAAMSLGADAHFHAVMLWLVVPTSALGFGLGYRVHRRADIIGFGVAAVAVLAVAAVIGHDAWSTLVETSVNVAASLALAAAHVLNFRLVRRLHDHGG